MGCLNDIAAATEARVSGLNSDAAVDFSRMAEQLDYRVMQNSTLAFIGVGGAADLVRLSTHIGCKMKILIDPEVSDPQQGCNFSLVAPERLSADSALGSDFTARRNALIFVHSLSSKSLCIVSPHCGTANPHSKRKTNSSGSGAGQLRKRT